MSSAAWAIAWMALSASPGGGLDVGDLGADLVGGARRLFGQRLDLRGDHREAAPGLAGARRLDGGVERQHVGLLGDVADDLDDGADLFRQGDQGADMAVRVPRRGAGLVDAMAHAFDLPEDFLDRRGQLLGGGGHRLHVLRGLAGGAVGFAGGAAGAGGDGAECFRRVVHLAGARAERRRRWRSRWRGNRRSSLRARAGGRPRARVPSWLRPPDARAFAWNSTAIDAYFNATAEDYFNGVTRLIQYSAVSAPLIVNTWTAAGAPNHAFARLSTGASARVTGDVALTINLSQTLGQPGGDGFVGSGGIKIAF